VTSNLTEEQLQRLVDLQKMKDEPLHPDLAACMGTAGESRFPIIRHPLVQELFPINGLVNQKYEEKQKHLQEAIEAEDWHTVVFLHERPYRCDALIDYVVGRDGHTDEVLPVQHMSEEVRELVADVWRDSENIEQHIDDWNQMIAGWEPGDAPMFIDEPGKYDLLPEHVTVWRGDVADGRWSWSLDKKVALFFARRWNANVPLLSGIVRKDCIFGYLTGRSENEVMCHYEHVTCVREHDYEKRQPK
jgi:hypothetical protein